MKRLKLILLCFILSLGFLLAGGLLLCLRAPHVDANFTAINDITLIAHAGGGLPIGTYSNSQQALDLSVQNGFSFIEVDFSQAKNGDWVLARDWDKTHYKYFTPFPSLPNDISKRLYSPPNSAADYKARKMRGGLIPMDMDDLVDWVGRHPDIAIVTDFKGDNIDGLTKLAQRIGPRQSQVIPQIYHPDEYAKVKALGYERIILTIYRLTISDQELETFMADQALFALTIPSKQLNDTLMKVAKLTQTPVFSHTVNKHASAERLKNMGVSGLYTDYLFPERLGAAQSHSAASLQ